MIHIPKYFKKHVILYYDKLHNSTLCHTKVIFQFLYSQQFYF